ncbi:MAG: DUF4905 domain-containing protein [Janthinobacterium lividum]
MAINLNPVINYAFSGVIWKLECDAASGLIYVETRNSEEHTAAFSSFDLKNGKTYFQELVMEEKWMIGLEGGRQGILFLHGHKSDQSPEHKALIALDGLTGKQVWADYNLSLEAFTTDGLLAADQRFQTKRTVMLDYKTGNIISNTNKQQDDFQEIQYPFLLRLLPENLAPIIAGTITGEISCLNYNSFLIISLHTINNGLLLQELFIIEDETTIYHDLLNEHIEKLQPEAFVMIKNHLVYTQNKNILKVLTL